MLLRDKGARVASFATTLVFGLYIAGWFLIEPVSNALPGFAAIPVLGKTALLSALSLTILYAIYWSVLHRLDLGPRYAFTHALTIWRLKRALLDVGVGYAVEQYSGQEKVAVLPKIKVSFDRDLLCGTIKIRNHIKYDSSLEAVNLSSALGRYVVEQQYLSDDENWYVFEIEDGQANRRLVFDNYQDFQKHCRKQENYTLFVDKKTALPLCSLLLVGETGSGKTYTLYSLILQFLNWKIAPVLYFIDPKNSSLCVMGQRIAPDRTAEGIDEIIGLLEQFHAQMQERKSELKMKLEEKLDADYRHWEMPAHVLIFDEFAAFQGVVNTLDKATRDKVAMLTRNIVLQGRQLGFFLWTVMQKSDSKDIPTAIRDNLPWKVVLGRASDTTYMTAFEHSADLPKRNFGHGEGLYTYQGKTSKPKITAFPTLEFDILAATLEAVRRGPPVV